MRGRNVKTLEVSLVWTAITILLNSVTFKMSCKGACVVTFLFLLSVRDREGKSTQAHCSIEDQ